jgi:hypothetical protein
MRLLLPILLLLFAAVPLPAAEKDKAKPNTLTPKEIAEGWILLFDGQTTFGWKTEGEVKAANGFLVLGGAKPSSARATSRFLDYELYFEFFLKNGKEFRAGYEVKGRTPGPIDNLVHGEWVAVALQLKGSNGEEKVKITSKPFKLDGGGGGSAWGMSNVAFTIAAGNQVKVRNIKLRPLGLKTIFNGKDLTGWKEIKTKRTKSKFTVTDKGELHLKNGPGDLQTTGQWKDFILQIDCFSNGKHLNSGVFFRCIPGEYQQGYEAQIRNQWKDDDRSKPVDYGTGAIYRRQPARKVVSNDKEWFTMTIIAEGKHLAIWVNGYQTADFTDTRAVSDNARTGCKLGAGPISLQGHDSTTDLLFRHIRIAELPAAAKK